MDSGVKLEHHSPMTSFQFCYQYSWTTKKKRSLKPFKSKGFSSSSSSREEGGTRLRVYSRKRNHSRADNDGSAVKRNVKRRKTCKVEESGDEFEVIPKSVKEEQCSEDDDCILGDWMRKRTVKRSDKRKEEVEVRLKIESGEHFEDDDCFIGNRFSEISSQRRDRRQVELEEDEEWEEQLRLIEKIKATSSRSRTRNLSSNKPENVTDVSPSCSRSPASDVTDSLLKNGISNDCTSIKQVNVSLYSIKEEMKHVTVLKYIKFFVGRDRRKAQFAISA